MTDDLTAEQYFERAVERAVNRRDFQGAVADLTEAIRLKPDWAKAYSRRGEARLNLHDRDGALSDAEQALRLEPDHAQAKFLRELIRSIPTTPEQAYQQIMNIPETIANDHQKTILYGRALHRLSIENPDLDIQQPMDNIMKDDPTAGYLLRGAYFQALNEREKAVEAYTQAIRLNPQLAEAYLERANTYGGFGRLQEALADYTHIIELYTQQGQHAHNIAKVYYRRGLLRGHTGDPDGAIADLSDAIRLRRDSADFFYVRAGLLEDKQDIDGAIDDYTNAIHYSDGDPLDRKAISFINRGRLREDKGDLEGALTDWKAYLTLGGGEQYGDRAEVEGWIKELTLRLESGE